MGLLCQVRWYKINHVLNIPCRFDDTSNKEANKICTRGVMAVNKDSNVTPSTVKRKV